MLTIPINNKLHNMAIVIITPVLNPDFCEF